jgi:hypothetical protein
LGSINLSIGKIFIKRKYFFACGFVGPNYGTYSYVDKRTVTIRRFDAPGVSVSAQLYTYYKRATKEAAKEGIVAGAGIGIELSANTNKNMSAYAFRIITPIVMWKCNKKKDNSI